MKVCYTLIVLLCAMSGCVYDFFQCAKQGIVLWLTPRQMIISSKVSMGSKNWEPEMARRHNSPP